MRELVVVGSSTLQLPMAQVDPQLSVPPLGVDAVAETEILQLLMALVVDLGSPQFLVLPLVVEQIETLPPSMVPLDLLEWLLAQSESRESGRDPPK